MEQELRFGLDLGRFGNFFLKKFKKKLGQETFSIVSCSIRDPSPRDFSIMTLVKQYHIIDLSLEKILKLRRQECWPFGPIPAQILIPVP